MPNLMDEEQMGFLDELLGGVPQEAEQNEDVKTDDLQDPEQSGDATKVEDATEDEDTHQADDTKAEDTTPTIEETLRAQIVQLTEQLTKDPMVQKVADATSDPAQKEDKGVVKKVDKLEDFLTADEVDRIIDEPQLLNVAFNRAIGVMQQNMQMVIQQEVNRQVLVSRAVSDFYTQNPDLAPYGKFVQFVMGEIEQQNPNSPYSEIFQKTAEESRKRLGLSVQAQEQSRDNRQSTVGKQKPAFAGSKKGSPRPAGKQEFFDPNAADMFS